MSLTPRLDLRQSQTLTMTPRLQQAIRLLQMSSLELEAAVAEELEQNPFLEREGDPSENTLSEQVSDESEYEGRGEMPSLLDSADGEKEADLDTNDIPTEDSFYEQAGAETFETDFDFSMDVWEGSGARGEREAGLQSVDLCAAPRETLYESLAGQINMSFKSPRDRNAAFALLEKLDENGYLSPGYEDVCPPGQLEKILPVLQGFSPPGIFARSLAECLAVQLKEKNRYDPAMAVMLEHLELIGQREYKKLSRLCGVDESDIADMIAEIRRLSPHPAAGFDDTPPAVLVPDVLLRRDKAGNFIVELNQAVLPRVLINRTYAAEISAYAKHDKAAKKFMTDRMAAAGWLVKALNQRAETILKVAAEIVERQKDFFKDGEKALKPMVLKDVAEAVGMHESTVSRVTAQKYIASSRGIFELKYFFSQALESLSGGDSHSAQAVKSRIKELIENEKKENILSDEAIVLLLKQEGIEIARRTVAKYREAMGLPTSAQRKRDKRLNA